MVLEFFYQPMSGEKIVQEVCSFLHWWSPGSSAESGIFIISIMTVISSITQILNTKDRRVSIRSSWIINKSPELKCISLLSYIWKVRREDSLYLRMSVIMSIMEYSINVTFWIIYVSSILLKVIERKLVCSYKLVLFNLPRSFFLRWWGLTDSESGENKVDFVAEEEKTFLKNKSLQ